MYEFVHAARTQGGAHNVGHRYAGIDVADQLRFSLTGVRTFLEKDDLWLLQGKKREQGGGGPVISCNRLGLSVPAANWHRDRRCRPLTMPKGSDILADSFRLLLDQRRRPTTLHAGQC
jgi:hypothetical protein